MNKKIKGFTMVELLVVLVIIGILAAVATPLFIQNTRRARASEAIATMSLIRQALRDYNINTGKYFTIAKNATEYDSNIDNPLPSSVTGTTPTPATAGVAVDADIAQYFSNRAYSVDADVIDDNNGLSNLFDNPPAQDFIVLADGDDSDLCTADEEANCALKADEVNNGSKAYILEMDNSGRIFISYDNGTNWSPY